MTASETGGSSRSTYWGVFWQVFRSLPLWQQIAFIVFELFGFSIGSLPSYWRLYQHAWIGWWYVLWASLVAFTFVVTYRVGGIAWLRSEKHWRTSEQKLAALTASRPNIVFDQCRRGMVHNLPNGSNRYEVVQAWFLNRPASRTAEAVARDVSATVEIVWQDRQSLHFLAPWAQYDAPDHLGHTGLASVIDIPPNDLPAKLVIALQCEGEADAYAYALENLGSSAKGRHAAYRINPGHYKVRVTLRGVGVDREFAFKLENAGHVDGGLILELER